MSSVINYFHLPIVVCNVDKNMRLFPYFERFFFWERKFRWLYQASDTIDSIDPSENMVW